MCAQLRSTLQGFRVGAELCDSILLELLVRWNEECAIRHADMPDYGVTDPELLDELHDVVRRGACAAAHIVEVESWKRTIKVDDAEVEEFGACR